MKEQDGSLLEVLLTTIHQTKKEIHVATLAIIEAIDEVNLTVKCKPFPIGKGQNEKSITVYCLNNTTEFEVGNVIVVLFMDRDFIANLIQIRNGKIQIYNTDDSEFHSELYGIAVKTF